MIKFIFCSLLFTSCVASPPAERTSPPKPETAESIAPTKEEPVNNELGAITYQIEGKSVSADDFNAFLKTLEVEPDPYITGELIGQDMKYNGWEVGYHAVDPKTKQSYRLFETQMDDYHAKTLALENPENGKSSE